MILLTALTVVALSTGSGVTDTTFAVRTGTRLSLENYLGDVALDAWSRDAVRIRATHRHNVSVAIASTPGRLELSAEGRWGPPGSVDWHITIPTWMAATIEGIGSDVSAEGVLGDLKIETVKGDVTVTHCASAGLTSVEGAVTVSDCRGRVEASSVNDVVRIRHCSGELQLEAVNGDVIIEDSDSPGIEASSVNGSVLSAGPFRDGGSYSFSSHDGNVLIGLPERASVSVTASTYGGALSSDFPLQFTEKHKGREYRFTLGDGAASLELDSFQGQVRLLRIESWTRALKQLEAEPHEKHDKHQKDSDEKDKDESEEDK